jgi:hypothetical protein
MPTPSGEAEGKNRAAQSHRLAVEGLLADERDGDEDHGGA